MKASHHLYLLQIMNNRINNRIKYKKIQKIQKILKNINDNKRI
jgi:hypothetical protein